MSYAVALARSIVASLAILLVGPAAIAQPAATGAPCQAGAYRSAGGGLLAISTPPTGGFRYTFLDGRRGLITDSDALVACDGNAVIVRQPDGNTARWTQVPLRITPTRFSSAGVTLNGMLIEPPAGGEPPPLVVMAHGSENFGWLPSTQAPPFLQAAQGVSTFIFDKHGTGGSGGTFHMNFRRLADDLVAASAEARRLARGRYRRFGIHGGSQGGWTAPLAARRAGADFLIVSFGGLFSPQEEDSEQVLDELRAAGFGEDVLAQAREITAATGRVMASDFREGFEELARLKAAYSAEPWFARIRGEYTGRLLSAPEADLRRATNQDQIDWLHDGVRVIREQVDIPILWVLAEQDREAPGRLTEDRLRTLIAEGKPIQVVTFPETDHGMVEFVEAPDGTRRYTRVTDGYYRLIADWTRQRLADPASYGRARFWPAPGP